MLESALAPHHVPKRWRLASGNPEAAARIATELALHPVVAHLLAQRGQDTPEKAYAFLHPAADAFHDPFLLEDMEIACERMKRALHAKERVLVHGDYDTDGVTSASLMGRFLRKLGGCVDVFVPTRERDGHGLKRAAIEQAKANGVSLIITTDCGIGAIGEVEFARAQGIEVIITDHHPQKTNDPLPKAVAVVDPNRLDSQYPFKDLCGAGVAFKFGDALMRHLGHNPAHFRRAFLDLAAIGTIGDMMALVGENRTICVHGVEALRATKKQGLRCLMDITGHTPEKPITGRGVSWDLSPRLNAAGRMGQPEMALSLLLAEDPQSAYRCAVELDNLNTQRKAEQNAVTQEALAMLAEQDVHSLLCVVLAKRGWPAGILGVIANKVKERVHRPVILLGINDRGRAHGSGRSVEGFNLGHAIETCIAEKILLEGGGHMHSVGVTLEAARVEEFALRVNEIAAEEISLDDLVMEEEAHIEVAPDALTLGLIEQIEKVGPYGKGNAEPVFVSRNVTVAGVRRIGSEKQHLSLTLSAGGENPDAQIGAPWWGQGDLAEHILPGAAVDVFYEPQINTYRGRKSVQFMVKDLHKSAESVSLAKAA